MNSLYIFNNDKHISVLTEKLGEAPNQYNTIRVSWLSPILEYKS